MQKRRYGDIDVKHSLSSTIKCLRLCLDVAMNEIFYSI